MCSSPSVLKSQGEIELAIKVSSWAPANWVHTRCRPGDWVTFRYIATYTQCSSYIDDHLDLVGISIIPLRISRRDILCCC